MRKKDLIEGAQVWMDRTAVTPTFRRYCTGQDIPGHTDQVQVSVVSLDVPPIGSAAAVLVRPVNQDVVERVMCSRIRMTAAQALARNAETSARKANSKLTLDQLRRAVRELQPTWARHMKLSSKSCQVPLHIWADLQQIKHGRPTLPPVPSPRPHYRPAVGAEIAVKARGHVRRAVVRGINMLDMPQVEFFDINQTDWIARSEVFCLWSDWEQYYAKLSELAAERGLKALPESPMVLMSSTELLSDLHQALAPSPTASRVADVSLLVD